MWILTIPWRLKTKGWFQTTVCFPWVEMTTVDGQTLRPVHPWPMAGAAATLARASAASPESAPSAEASYIPMGVPLPGGNGNHTTNIHQPKNGGDHPKAPVASQW